MGRVWRGHDPLIGRPVAVKTVKAEYLTRETREEYLQRFRREARAAGLLSHPNIVSLFDVGEDFFVMELLEGVTLADLIRRRGRLPLADVLALLEPVADAIDYAHRAGVIHRDIKPGNIMVQPDGQPKLMDFGVARLETSIVTAPGHFFGSPSYMAPEQITRSEATALSDLFSFAVVAYEALTGERPFAGDSITAIIYQVVNGAPAPPCTLVPDLPPAFDDVFRRALAKKPEQRFPAALSLIAALRGESFEAVAPEAGFEPAALALDMEVAVAGLEQRAGLGSAETVDIAARARDQGRGPRGRWSSLWSAVAATLALLAAGLVGVVRVQPPARADALPGLAIESDPSGALVSIDGKEAGRSPVVLSGLAQGPHRLRVTREGFAPAEVLVHVTSGMGVVPLRFALSGVTAPVEVRTQDGVTVRIDGRVVGRTPLGPVHVGAGVHELRLERPGFLPQRLALIARPGERLTVTARLLPAPAAEMAATLPAPTAIDAQPPPLEPEAPAPIEPARPVTLQPAAYPEEARRLQMAGSVLIEATIGTDGHVGDVLVLESAGSLLDEAVVKSVRRWVFMPARQGERPVRSTWQYRQTFRPR